MILYFCNGKKDDCAKCSCCYIANADDRCFHTTNADFARFGPLKEGSVIIANAKEKERPLFVQDEKGNWWEGFIGRGKLRDGVNNIPEDKMNVLEKIKAEIIDTGAYEQETKGQTEFLRGLNYCLNIIDEYKAKNEEE